MSTTTTETEKQQIKEAIVNVISELFEEIRDLPMFENAPNGFAALTIHIVKLIDAKVERITRGQRKYVSVELLLLNGNKIITELPELRQTPGVQIVCKQPEHDITLVFAIHHAPHLSATSNAFYPYVQPVETNDFRAILDLGSDIDNLGEKQ